MAAYCQDNGNTKKDWTPICLYAMRTYSLSVIHRRMPIGTKMHHRRCACPQLSFVLCGWVTPHHKPTHKPHHKYQLTRKVTHKVTHIPYHNRPTNRPTTCSVFGLCSRICEHTLKFEHVASLSMPKTLVLATFL